MRAYAQAAGLLRAFLTGFDIVCLAMKTATRIRNLWTCEIAAEGRAFFGRWYTLARRNLYD